MSITDYVDYTEAANDPRIGPRLCKVCGRLVLDDGDNNVFKIQRNGRKAQVRIHKKCGTSETYLEHVRKALRYIDGEADSA